MQGEIQKWVDHSISVTVNVPENISVKKVDEIYRTAWKSGCKGMTIYREGSRSGVLVSADDKKNKPKDAQQPRFMENHSPKRPKKLEAEIVRFKNNNKEWIAVVGLMDGRPYEIFTGEAEDTFRLPRTYRKCWVVKVKDKRKKQSRYDLHLIDKDGYKMIYEGLSRSFNKEYWNYAKLISGVLRHGMPLPSVIDLISGLHMDNETINTWKNGVIRALKRFIPDGTKVKDACPKCQQEGVLQYKEGCLTCASCGYSKCS